MNPKTFKITSYVMLIMAALNLILNDNISKSVTPLIICISQYMIYHELKDKEKNNKVL